MTQSDTTFAAQGGAGSSGLLRALVPLFTITLFTSALLLFWIQPLLTKMALPLLGGAPAVWNIAMVFFQATLLAGYGYAHFASRRFSLRGQVYLHLAVVVTALFALPLALRGSYDPAGEPTMSLLLLLAASVGLPFFAISASAPLLQRWFAESGHRHGDDPYFLYSASNLGSILALLAFPFVLEPLLTLGEQSAAWTALYLTLLCFIAACGCLALRSARPNTSSAPASVPAPSTAQAGVTWRCRGLWILLAFAPSSLLLGVTQHITTDIAAVPLLWVIPLALYLLTFVIAFARRPFPRHAWVLRAQPYLLVVALLALLPQNFDIRFAIALHLSVFFLLALSCHGELVRRRPPVRHLTDFYLSMSLGGVLGGLFNVLLAPELFSGVYEYALAVVAACLLRPGAWGGGKGARLQDLLLPLGLLLAFFLVRGGPLKALAVENPIAVFLIFGVAGILVFGFQHRPLRYGLGVVALLFGVGSLSGSGPALEQLRSFFGVYRVVEAAGGEARILLHGTTLHGAQQIAEATRLEPVTYYTQEGPLGQAFAALRSEGPLKHVGLVGLGVGSALCYAQEGDAWTIFEIDPTVVQIAQDRRYFSYWDSCFDEENFRLLVGDARLRLEELPDAAFDLLILDAYSSDAIPVHLLTREALALYAGKLTPGGVLLFHISSRHLDLEPVLAALARDAGWVVVRQLHRPGEGSPALAKSSIWAALARDEISLSAITASGEWQTMRNDGLRPWSDDYSNIVSVLR